MSFFMYVGFTRVWERVGAVGGGMFGHSTTGYAENILEIATKQSNIFKYFILF